MHAKSKQSLSITRVDYRENTKPVVMHSPLQEIYTLDLFDQIAARSSQNLTKFAKRRQGLAAADVGRLEVQVPKSASGAVNALATTGVGDEQDIPGNDLL